MPEGDTVYLAAKRMAAALNGQRLTRGELRHPRLAEHDLSGRTVLGVHSVGKQQWVFPARHGTVGHPGRTPARRAPGP
jgi:formamidopyrimidine-DNA glycosylase